MHRLRLIVPALCALILVSLCVSLGSGCSGDPDSAGDASGEVLATIALTETSGEVLALERIDPSAPPAAATPRRPPDVGLVTWELHDDSGQTRASGTIPDPRRAESEVVGAGGALTSEVTRSRVALVELRVPNVGGELAFYEPDPAALHGASVRPRSFGSMFRSVSLPKLVDQAFRVLGVAPGPPPSRVLGTCGAPFNVLFVPEGYTQAELPLFDRAASRLASEVMAVPVFSEHEDAFAFWLRDIPSSESGISDPGCTPDVDGCPPAGAAAVARSTAFGVSYGTGASDDPRRNAQVSFAKDALGQALYARAEVRADVIVVLANVADRIGSMIYPFGVNIVVMAGECAEAGCGRTSTGRILAHELGHALFGLADEYGEGARCDLRAATGPNVANDLGALPWKDLVTPGVALPTPATAGASAIGAFEGAAYCDTGAYRAQLECLMHDETQAPCAACRRQMDAVFRTATARSQGDVCSLAPSGDAGAGPDAPPPGDGGDGGDGGDASKLGTVAIAQTPGSAFATALFSDPPFATGCARSAGVACDVSDCPGQPVPAIAPKSAGPITFTGALLPAAGVTITADPGGTYAAAPIAGRAWNGGEQIVAVGAGSAAVPAFQAKGVAPIDAIWSSPALPPSGTPFALSRGSPLQIQWTGGSGQVTVSLRGSKPGIGQGVVALDCVFDAAAGGGTIPVADLELLPASPSGPAGPQPSGQLSASVWTQSTTAAGDWTVATSFSSPVTAGGVPASASLVLE
jgi:hypothetical protein